MIKLVLKYKTILMYLISSVLSFLVDILSFSIILWFLKERISCPILVASYSARLISSVFNYLVNKNYVFVCQNKGWTSWWQYFLLVVVNVTISGTLVTKLHNLIHFNVTILKVFIDALIFLVNFFVQKLFIFKCKNS